MTQPAVLRTILLATDGSADAEQAAVYARELALHHRATVLVVHAVPDLPTTVAEPDRSAIVGRNLAAGEEAVRPVVAELHRCGVRVVTEILAGEPGEAILRATAARQPDLVIMGRQGCDASPGLLPGSASHRVLADAQVPVLVVRSLNGRSS